MRRVTGPVEEGVIAAEAAFYARLRPLVETYARSGSVRRVAVIGNQPLEPSAERAEIVDSADLVFRVNGFRADSEGEAPTVGRRTDVVVFNRGVRPTPWFFQGYSDRLYLMVEPGRLHWENPKLAGLLAEGSGYDHDAESRGDHSSRGGVGFRSPRERAVGDHRHDHALDRDAPVP
jgi:hypothetical protein